MWVGRLLATCLLVTACSAGTRAPAEVGPPLVSEGMPSPAAPSRSAEPSPRPSASPQSADRADPTAVDWDSGRGTADRPEPDPSPSGWYEAVIGGSPADQGRVLYVTFDDGPGEATRDVLDLLDRYGARATFFVVGREAAQRPSLVRAAHRAGHGIGNHTWDHADLTGLSTQGIAEQLARTSEAVGDAMGGCMRPPYGEINNAVGRQSLAAGLLPVMWSGQAWDWRPPPTADIVADMKAATEPGAVLLLHDGGGDRSRTVAALRSLLPYWQQEGYELRPIAACMTP